MSDIEWQRQTYDTEAEAKAFADGLAYGDEPKFTVDTIEPCRFNDGKFDVVFAYTDEVEDSTE